MSSVVESTIAEIGFGKFQARLLLLCASGYFAVCSELLLAVFLQEPLTKHFSLDAGQYALFPFSVSLCSLVASFLAGRLADISGRKAVFNGSLLLVGSAGILCAFSKSYPMLVGLRCLVAVGNGGLTVVDYVVFQEFTPPAFRGSYLYCIFAAGCLGVLYLASFAAFLDPRWEVLVLLAALPTLPTALFRCLVTLETPHYLVAAGRRHDAYAVLQLIAKTNGFQETLVEESDFLHRTEPGPREEIAKGSVVSVLRYAPKHLTMPLSLIWLLQSTAYWGLSLFLPRYFALIGISANSAIFAMVACELPGCALSALLIDHRRVGRVWTMRINFSIASFAALALAVSAGPPWAMVALACLVYFAMIPIWGVLFIFTPESYPTELRATAMGFFQTIQGITSVLSPFLSASLVQKGRAYMSAWGGVLLFGALVAMMLRPTRKDEPLSLAMAPQRSELLCSDVL